jgi:hypothetical protein
MTLLFYCLFITILFFGFGKIKFYEPKGIFVLGSVFYIVFGMSGTLDVIRGDINIPNELKIAIAIAFTPLIFLINKRKYTNIKGLRISNFSIKTIRNLSLIIGFIGFLFMIQKIGGLSVFENNPNRVLRNQLITESGGNFPYILFFFIGFASSLMLEFYRNSTVRRIFFKSFIFISPLLLYNLLEGERSNIIKFLFIAYFFYIIKFEKKQFKLGVFKSILLVIGFSIFSIMGNVRSHLNLAVASGDASVLVNVIQNKDITQLLIPNEPKAVAFTWRYTYKLLNNGFLDYQYGYTYFQGIPYFFPTSVYKIFNLKKNKTISDQIGDIYAKEYGYKKKVGFGYLGISELYLNFGLISCIFFFPIFFSMISFIEYQARISKSISEIVAIAFLPYIAFFAHRVSFASVLATYIWFFFIAISLYIITIIIKQILISTNKSIKNSKNIIL